MMIKKNRDVNWGNERVEGFLQEIEELLMLWRIVFEA